MTTDMARLYDEDFYAWTQLQARELRRIAGEQSNLALDLPHLAEEVRDLGKEQRNALRSLTRQVIVPLLLLQFSPAARPRAGWRAEIIAARASIADRLTGTLQRDLQRRLPKLYEEAREEAAAKLEVHGEHAALPEFCPYGLPDVMKRGWYPERHSTPEP
jgi:hypothetical protein